MGIFDNGNKIYSPKYITAEITDDNDNIHFFPITHTFDGFFMVEIDKQLYAFTTKNARILRYRQKLVKSFGVIQYDVSHYSSIKKEFKELEIALKKNGLPRLNRTLFGALDIFAKREKSTFGKYLINKKSFDTLEDAQYYLEEHKLESAIKHDIHDINALIKEFETLEGQYPEKVSKIQDFLHDLNIDQVVTPLRRITECLQEDFLATSPNFLASAVPKLEAVDFEHKKVTNSEIKGHKNLMLYMLIGIVIVAAIIGIAYANEKGAFSGITSFTNNLGTIKESFQGLPSPTGGFKNPAATKADKCSDEYVQAHYTPEQLKVAINAGEMDYNCLSDTTKKYIGDLPPIEVAP